MIQLRAPRRGKYRYCNNKGRPRHVRVTYIAFIMMHDSGSMDGFLSSTYSYCRNRQSQNHVLVKESSFQLTVQSDLICSLRFSVEHLVEHGSGKRRTNKQIQPGTRPGKPPATLRYFQGYFTVSESLILQYLLRAHCGRQ